MSDSVDSSLALVRLLQVASPALPIGAYSYSQGLEWVVEQGAVRDVGSASIWIGEMLEIVVAPGEAAILWRLLETARGCEWREAADWVRESPHKGRPLHRGSPEAAGPAAGDPHSRKKYLVP